MDTRLGLSRKQRDLEMKYLEGVEELWHDAHNVCLLNKKRISDIISLDCENF